MLTTPIGGIFLGFGYHQRNLGFLPIVHAHHRLMENPDELFQKNPSIYLLCRGVVSKLMVIIEQYRIHGDTSCTWIQIAIPDYPKPRTNPPKTDNYLKLETWILLDLTFGVIVTSLPFSTANSSRAGATLKPSPAAIPTTTIPTSATPTAQPPMPIREPIRGRFPAMI